MTKIEKKVDSSPARRLRSLRQKAGFEDAIDFINEFGLTEPSYRSHENATRGITVKKATQYATLINRVAPQLNASANWILLGDDTDNVNIKAYDVNLSAGAGSIISDEDFLYNLSFRREWLRKITRAPEDKLAAVYVEGRSMEPTLYDGDPVLIDLTQTSFTKEGIFAIRYNGEAFIKRLIWDAETSTLRIISDNPSFPERKVKKLDMVTVIGKALWTGRKL